MSRGQPNAERRSREDTRIETTTERKCTRLAQKDTGDPGARSTGFVSLVGAGPGDPDLLTQRAVRRLAEADLVLYDALVSPDVLPLASRAQCLSVGKRACKPSISQEAINRVPRARRAARQAGGPAEVRRSVRVRPRRRGSDRAGRPPACRSKSFPASRRRSPRRRWRAFR